MFHVLIHVRVLNLHVGPRLGAILDNFVDLNQLKSLEVEEDQINSRANQTDAMGGLHWPLSAFL